MVGSRAERSPLLKTAAWLLPWALLAQSCSRKSSCPSSCATEGATRCVGAGAMQTCVQDATCLQWGPSVACEANDVCVADACLDECQTTAIAKVCDQAATNIANCCTDIYGAAKLCHDALTAGQDPTTACTAQAAASCADLHAAMAAQGACCCPAGQACDDSTPSLVCATLCARASDCANDAGRPSCAPNVGSDNAPFGPMLCKPSDGLDYDGCDSSFSCQSSAAACFADALANTYCAQTCALNSDCGSAAQVCCQLTDRQGSPVPAMGCAPCTAGGG